MTVNIAGYEELYVNGRKVGGDVLTPAVSDQARQVFYVTCDVTPLLHKGRNVVGIWLGRGWAHGKPKVRVQLDATLPGRAFCLGTDATWKIHTSPYRHIGGWKWNHFGGERYDARDAIPDWCKASLDDGDWANAVEVDAPAGKVLAQRAPLNRIGKTIPAVAVKKLPAAGKDTGGRYEIDFGTALTGWLRLKMPPLKAGTVVKMTFADVVRNGKYQHFNQVSEFVSSGKPGEVFENKFNYAGFRYVVVEGLPSAPAKQDAEAMLIESDLAPAGAFECSNELLNRIHKLTRWTQRCLDLGGYYVDCPHRERMGYGDGQVAAEGFMMNFHAAGYYRKWLWDWRLRQTADGDLPHMAPFGKGGGGPGWPGLLAAITWRHYLYYGDRRVLEENYDAVRRYVDWLEAKCTDGVLRKYGGKWDFIGDWVPPRRGMDTHNWPGPESAELFNNCYRVYQMQLLEKMAAALGHDDEVARCRARLAKIRPLIHKAFYDAANKRYVIDEQAYYVMPLMTGVTPEADRPAVLKNLAENILVRNAGHLDTGMLGTYFMMEYLRQIGRDDLVFTMFNQRTYPSWGHMLAEGATTCWEQWNGYYSHIHSCFTSADNWLYQGPAGIVPDPAGAGFGKIIIRPAVVGDLTWVKAHHDSPTRPGRQQLAAQGRQADDGSRHPAEHVGDGVRADRGRQGRARRRTSRSRGGRRAAVAGRRRRSRVRSRGGQLSVLGPCPLSGEAGRRKVRREIVRVSLLSAGQARRPARTNPAVLCVSQLDQNQSGKHDRNARQLAGRQLLLEHREAQHAAEHHRKLAEGHDRADRPADTVCHHDQQIRHKGGGPDEQHITPPAPPCIADNPSLAGHHVRNQQQGHHHVLPADIRHRMHAPARPVARSLGGDTQFVRDGIAHDAYAHKQGQADGMGLAVTAQVAADVTETDQEDSRDHGRDARQRGRPQRLDGQQQRHHRRQGNSRAAADRIDQRYFPALVSPGEQAEVRRHEHARYQKIHDPSHVRRMHDPERHPRRQARKTGQ